MKKLLLIISLLVSVVGFSQTNKVYANSGYDINGKLLYYLNSTDSIGYWFPEYFKIIKPLYSKGWTTAARPTPARNGYMGYNTDSLAFEFYNGAWRKFGIFDGSVSVGYIPKISSGNTFSNSLINEVSGQVSVAGRMNVTDQFYVAQLSSDPATNLVNGGLYYNTATQKIRVYENSAWKNLASIISGSSFVDQVSLTPASGFSVSGASPQTGAVAFGFGTSLGAGPIRSTGSANAIALGPINLAGGGTEVTGNLPVTNIAPGSNGQYLTTTGGVTTWGTLSGGGDVVGPASAVTLQYVQFNGTTGKLIQAVTGTGYPKLSSGVATYITSIPSADITDLVYTKVNNFPTASLAGRSTAGTGALEQITWNGTLQMSAGVLSVNEGSLTLSLHAGAVTTAQGGLPTAGTVGQILEKINSTNYNTQWATRLFITDADKGDITVSSSGTAFTIDNLTVTYAKMQNVAAARILGNNAGGPTNVTELTGTQVTAMLDVATPSLKGLAPSGGTANQLLRINSGGTALEWATVAAGESTTASNGLALSGLDVKLGGNLTQNTALNGSFNLEFGLIAPLANFAAVSSANLTIQAANTLNLQGMPKFATETASDANYTWTTASIDPAYVDLPTITANRNLTLPTNDDGLLLVVSNLNNATFKWNFVGSVKNQAGSVITEVPYGVTRLRGNGTDWIIQGTEGTKGLIVLQANDVNSDATANTLDDVEALVFPVQSGITYRFKFFVVYSAAATTTGSRWTISTPAVTFVNYNSTYTLTATTETKNQALAAQNLPGTSNASSAATGSNIAQIEGVIRASANGNVTLRFASEVASSAITALAFRSYVEYEAIR